MKILKAKRLEKLYFEIWYDFETESYKREFIMRKVAYVTFLGIPILAIKYIYLNIPDNEVTNVGHYLIPV